MCSWIARASIFLCARRRWYCLWVILIGSGRSVSALIGGGGGFLAMRDFFHWIDGGAR